MTVHRAPRRGLVISSFVVCVLIVLTYGLPASISVVAIVVLGLAFYKGGPFAALTTTLALLLITGLYAVAIQFAGLEDAIYFQPHAKYGSWDHGSHHKVYRRNVTATMEVPHGNLQGMTSESIAVPRTVRFVTDSDGFRNDRDYHGQEYVLLGDSFVVGNGSDQADTLRAQLERDYAIDTYDLAYSGDPYDYLLYVDGFRRRHGDEFRILLFLFEGNDFRDQLSHPDRRRWSGWESAAKRVRMIFSDRSVYRVTRVLFDRAVRRKSIASSELVWVTELGGEPFGVYTPYKGVSEREFYRVPLEMQLSLELMGENLEHVFFIPTKYRVYHRQLGREEPLPNAQWEALQAICEESGFACTDLTAGLVRRSEELLASGELSWWRDDTHWNGHGIAVAAQAVAQRLLVDEL